MATEQLHGGAEQPPALSFEGVTKRFGGQLAVDDVTFDMGVGEVHALVGENGAGKSTLIKILSGEHTPDEGRITMRDEVVPAGHPWSRRDLGIAFIHQEPALFPEMSVAENIVIQDGYRDPRATVIAWRKQIDVAKGALAQVGLGHVNPRVRLDTLSVAERQLVAIARTLINPQRVVVFDEPTASLTEREAEILFGIIRQMRNRGVSVLYVSHRMEEIFALADRVTVMKDGRYVTTEHVADLTPPSLAALIIGTELPHRPSDHDARTLGDVVLEARGLTDSLMRGIDLDVRQGEILGLAGLAGSGRSNVVQALFGASDATGEITFYGESLRLTHPRDAIEHGIVMVTEERKADGYVPAFTISETITLPWLHRFARAGWLSLGRERLYARRAMKRFDVRARSEAVEIRDLSGGNQQKAILARWFTDDVKLILLDEPTHGVDVGAKDEIYRIVRDIAARGVPVIVISSELEELEGLCDRVLVLVRGEVVEELAGASINKPEMLRAVFAERPRQEVRS